MFALFLMTLIQWGSAIEGQFYFQGEQVLRQAQRVEVIPIRSSKAVERVKDLKGQGYICAQRNSYYRCQKFLDISQLTDVPVVKPKQDSLRFGPVKGKEVLVDGQDLLQYQVKQEIMIGDNIFATALYTHMKSEGLIKVTVPNAKGDYHFLVHENQELSQLYFPRKKESRWAWKSYIKEVFYSKTLF